MATNWIFYPQSSKIEASTAVDDVGSSTTRANLIDNRWLSLCQITVSAGQYRVQLDLGSGVALAPDFYAVVNHSLNNGVAQTSVVYSSTDTLSGTSPGGTPTTLGANTIGASEEPIVVTEFTAPAAKRYWWFNISGTTTGENIGNFILGNIVEPVVDPNWESEIEIDIESGRIVNKGPGGYNWKTRTHDVKRGWQVNYELLNDADRATLEDWLSDSEYADTPFVFTTDGGTTFYYGELLGNPIITPVQQGLTNISFTISEVIA